MRNACLSVLFSLLVVIISGYSQKNITWGELSEVQWEEIYDSLAGVTLLEGSFSPHILALDSQEVYISGYVIPLDAMGLSYALSRTSFASCFFCGQAGPETVMELRVRPNSIEPRRQKNTLIKFKGLLRVNGQNDTGLHYELQKAEEVR